MTNSVVLAYKKDGKPDSRVIKMTDDTIAILTTSMIDIIRVLQNATVEDRGRDSIY